VQYWFDRFDLGAANIAMEELQNRVNYYPDTLKTLSALGEKFRLSIASGSPQHFLTYLLRDIKHHFCAIYSSISDFKNIKNADFYKKICQELGVDPDQVIHIGDNYRFDFIEPASMGIRAYHLDRERNQNNPGSLKDLSEFTRLVKALSE